MHPLLKKILDPPLLSTHSSKLCCTVDKARHKDGRVGKKSAITSVIYRRQKVWLHTLRNGDLISLVIEGG